MTAMHIFRFADETNIRPNKYPLCGQANAQQGIVITAGEALPLEASCKRCIKLHVEGKRQ